MAIQDALSAVDAAPLLSAGIAACSSLRHSDVRPGELLGFQKSLVSRGPLCIQFASKFGHMVVAIGRGRGRAALTRRFGANMFVDGNATEELQTFEGLPSHSGAGPSSQTDGQAGRRFFDEGEADSDRCHGRFH